MATKRSKVDTSALFRGLVGHDETELPKSKEIEVEEPETSISQEETKAAPAKAGRKANKEKNIQVSIYLTPTQAKMLRLQDAEKVKEADKSAIARTGIDIALSLSNEEYIAMKKTAEIKGVSVGVIVKEALANYL